MSTVLIGEISIGYEDRGAGQPLVLIHGHPFDRSMWAPQVDYFSRTGWRVIAPDLRGYGESTVVPGKTTLQAFAHDIQALLEHLGVDEFVLGGLAMGGQIVMEFHRLFPSRIRGLVLVDTFAAAETAAGKTAQHAIAERLLREGINNYAQEMLPKMVTSYTLEAKIDIAQHVLTMMSGTSAEGAAAGLRGKAERRDYIAMLAGIPAPTLIIVGADDEFTPVADAQLIHDRIPDARLEIMHGVAHMPNLECSAEFNTHLLDFLSALPAAVSSMA